MVSPDEASEIACLIVLHAVVGDVQPLLSLPLTPLTYQLLATASGARPRNGATAKILNNLLFIITSLSFRVSP